jgi:hypothetical protein
MRRKLVVVDNREPRPEAEDNPVRKHGSAATSGL